MPKKLLIIEDDSEASGGLARHFSKNGWQVVIAEGVHAARQRLLKEDFEPHVILADLGLPDGSILDHLEELQDAIRLTEWIFVFEQEATTDIERVDELAYDFLTQPLDLKRLEILTNRAWRSALTRRRLDNYSLANSSRFNLDAYIGKSSEVSKVKEMLRQLQDVPLSTMIISGETGTGKGLIAGIVHHTGVRNEGPFIELNCAALPRELLESQLFGHEAGAFTGAQKRHKGLFEQADGGTLFLDEIGDMDIELQAKLLKAIEDQKIRRLGSEKEIEIDVQIIAATGVNLEVAVVEGGFRDDLFHRLSVFCVELPTLRDRKEDLLELVPQFIAEFNIKANKQVDIITDATWEQLIAYEWPGNVRELRNVLERCVLLSKNEVLPIEWLQLKNEIAAAIDDDLQSYTHDCLSIPLDGSLALDEIEEKVIKAALRKTEDNVTEAARLLKTTRQTLRYRIGKYQIK